MSKPLQYTQPTTHTPKLARAIHETRVNACELIGEYCERAYVTRETEGLTEQGHTLGITQIALINQAESWALIDGINKTLYRSKTFADSSALSFYRVELISTAEGNLPAELRNKSWPISVVAGNFINPFTFQLVKLESADYQEMSAEIQHRLNNLLRSANIFTVNWEIGSRVIKQSEVDIDLRILFMMRQKLFHKDIQFSTDSLEIVSGVLGSNGPQIDTVKINSSDSDVSHYRMLYEKRRKQRLSIKSFQNILKAIKRYKEEHVQ